MTDQHDYLALDWVKGEIQETLNQAQQALEAYVENPDDTTRMRFCQTYLHQVYGTLQMVEFYGAALLAEEMEQLAHSLLDGKVSQVTDAQETLMRAILQLPPYLDRIQESRRDQPLVLMPLLNDLRASRGENLLSETSLFKPDLASGAGTGTVPEAVAADVNFPQLARKIRQMYQIALLGVIRGEDLPTNYRYMAKVFTKLRQVSGDAAMAPLWIIASAMVEGLSAGGVQLGTSVKLVLGHVDRVLKTLPADGVEALSAPPPPDVLKNLLYYIAKSEKQTPLIKKVREVYRLEDALPGEEALNEERARMSGPDQAAMGSVVQALSEELTTVKDALEKFVHNEESDVSKLGSQCQVLKQVADTVAVLGLGQPRQLINEQLKVLEDMAAGKRKPERDVLMDVAGSLLFVEATLQGMAGDRRVAQGRGELAVVPDHVERAREGVIRECRAALEEAKEGIVEFIASQWDRSHLEDVPEKLTSVRGALELILLKRPALILRQCVSFIDDKLLGEGEAKPEWRSMDTLADGITSVEYYLERLSDDPDSGDRVLDVARNSVTQLGYPISDEDFGRGEASAAEKHGAGLSALASEEIALSAVSQSAAAEAPSADGAVEAETADIDDLPEEDMSPPEPVADADEQALTPDDEVAGFDLELTEDDAQPEVEEVSGESWSLPEDAEVEEIAFEAPQTDAEEPAAVDEPEPQAVETTPEPEPEEEDDLIDDEIIEIFVEEAGEVLEALDEYFPRWAANTSDEEALVEFRRAFHTLKGSGRMVGATIVGELAWSIENMMNRVIDKSIEPTQTLIQLVQTVHGIIPEMVDAFQKRVKPPFDVQPLQDAAWKLAEGGSIDSIPDVRSAAAAAEAAPQAEADTSEPEEATAGADAPAVAVDPVLLDIFRTEADTNLGLLREWLGEIDRDLSENPMDDKVHRALHTLKGSARMAGVEPVATLAEPAEKFVKALISASRPANRDAVAMLEELHRMLGQALQEITAAGEVHMPGAEDLAQRLWQARSELQGDGGEEQDNHLMSVFLSEGMDLIMDADNLLERWSSHPDHKEELIKLRDELGALSVSAVKAGVAEIGELAGLLNECYSALADGNLADRDAFLALAGRAHEALITMMDYLAAGQTLRRDTELLAALRALLDEAEPAPDDSSSGGTDGMTLEWDAEDLDGMDFGEQDDTPASIEPPAWDSEADDPPIQGAAPAAPAQPQLMDLDPELLDIFLEEAEEVLESASHVLDAWEGGDASEVQALQRDLHTLKGGARMAGVTPIGDLAHELETLYEGFNDHLVKVSPDLFELLHRCHDRLHDMVEEVRGQQVCTPAPDLIAIIAGFMATGTLQAAPAAPDYTPAEDLSDMVEEAELVDEMPAPEPVAEPPPVSEPEPTAVDYPADDALDLPPVPMPEPAADTSERDPELVAIFLEEADEILESAGTSMESWMEVPENLIEVQSLQRDLHTLKGGARMAEVAELGDLSHELENLYEGLALGNLKPSPTLFELLQACHDRLAVMVEAVKANQSITPATELVSAIHSFMVNPDGFVMPALQAVAQPSPTPAPAATEAPAQPAAPSVTLPPDVDPEILGIFLDESAELCESLDQHLTAWQKQPDDSSHGDALLRVLHTLKGGARLAGLKELGDVSHDFETTLEDPAVRRAPTEDIFRQMHIWQDRINAQVQAITAAANAAAAPAAATAMAPAAEKPKQTQAEAQRDKQQAARKQASQQPQETVRIDAGVLESLVNLAGETSINRGRVEQSITEFAGNIIEMGNTVERLYEQLRRLDVETEATIMSNYQQGVEAGEFDEGFDPLEMDQYSELHQITKQLSESASDLLDLKGTLLDRTRDTETLLLQQSRINTELQETLMRTRMVAFSRLVPRLRRIVRQVSGEINKKVDFDVVNPEGELDRTLLERIVAPLEHMLRNAVDHGVEDAEGRAAAGKPEAGHVTLELTREGGEVVLVLADDGKGIDTEVVLKKAIERGLVEEGVQLTDREIQQFIFNAGFSTAAKVTQISGRGVGMDVVASEIKQMGGTVTIESVKGKGTRFIVRLPFTLAMNRALMVKVAEDSYAIPLNQIEGIVRISAFELEAFQGDNPPPFRYAGREYELDYLGMFVHGDKLPKHLLASPTPLPVLLIRSSEHIVAIVVDSLIGSREVVVKSVGPQLSTVAGISGATILGDGSVVIILDIHSLIRAAHVQRAHRAERVAAQPELAHKPAAPVEKKVEKKGPPLVMVTDDSVTVRKVSTRLLERAGYEVVTAKDGVDAIAKLEEYKPDVMLLDIEMPRMDGFEVAMHVRHEERLKDVPIIMITSRTGEKHRERAFDIGVNVYMGKPFQEGELLSTIADLLTQSQETTSS